MTTIFVLVSCNDSPKEINHKYSNTQTYLFNLLEDYKKDYYAENHLEKREKLQDIYQEKMHYFLADSLGLYIDSMTVIVDTVIQEGWLVTTQFHSKDIELKYGMRFQENMPDRVDSLYKFMINLSPGKEVTVNFTQLGGGELNFPDEKSKKTMRIFAYPSPLGF